MRHLLFVGALACASLSPSIAAATGVDPSAATPVQREQAQQRFNRGRALFTKRDFAKALEEFQGSHDIVASPNARLFVARCHRELGKLVSAYVELGRVAVEAHELEREDPRYAKTAEAANAERAEIAPKLGFVMVTIAHAEDQTKLTIGGDEIKRAGWGEPAPVMPGGTEIVVETPGRAPVRTTVTSQPGEQKAVTLDVAQGAPDVVAAAPPPPPPPPEAPPADRSGLRVAAFVSAGVGVAGLATFAIAGSMANGTYHDLQNSCHGPCPASRSSDISKGKSQQTIANVGLLVGAVGVAAGATLFVISLSKPKGETPRSDAAVGIAVGPTWMGLRGAF